MKSLSAFSILNALRNPEVAKTLIGIEVYNATAIDKMSNHYARILANKLKIAQTGNSDAHIVETIGFGATEFEGKSVSDLLSALRIGKTRVCKRHEWTAFRVLGSWAAHYAISTVTSRLRLAAQ